MHKYLIIIIVVLLFFSCKNSTVITESSLKTISFNTGISIRSKHSGTVELKGKEYVYFGNVNTSKTLKVFDLFTQELEWETSFKNVLKDCNAISDFSIINKDTIVILSKYTNKLFFINNKGVVWKKIHLNSLIQVKNNDYYEFSSFYSESEMHEGSNRLILSAEWRKNLKDTIKRNNEENIVSFYKNTKRSLMVLDLKNIFSDKPIYSFHFKMYEEIFNDTLNVFCGELPKYSKSENYFIFYSNYSNKLFFFTKKDFQKNKTIEIKPNKFNIGIEVVILDRENISNLQTLGNENNQSGAFISRVFYDDTNHKYFLKVYDKIPKGFYEKNHYRPWTLIEYDKDFKKISEKEFSGKNYLFVLNSKKGLLFLKKIKITNYKNQKATFDLYPYDE